MTNSSDADGTSRLQAQPPPGGSVWVVTQGDDDVAGRLGDAREIADRLGAPVCVLAYLSGPVQPSGEADRWIEQGADRVQYVTGCAGDQGAAVTAATTLWGSCAPRLVLSAADRAGRGWSARLAARTGWSLVSPALLVRAKQGRLVATALDASGERARQMMLPEGAPAIVALRPGVVQPLPRSASRKGEVSVLTLTDGARPRVAVTRLPPDPATADIRHLTKLVAGGRGVGGRAGFNLLRRIAARLQAGVAASRMAVDLGWIESERQVGQTGKTVSPDLYLACGISGATHHLEGMSDSRCIIAINTDPRAPLLQRAHLSLVADLHQVLEHLDRELEQSV